MPGDNVCRADSLIEKLANPWLFTWFSDLLLFGLLCNCDKHETDQGRSEFRRFCLKITLTSAVSGSADPPIISTDVHWEFEPFCRHVAIESAKPSEVSESRAAESDSVVYSPDASQSVVGFDGGGWLEEFSGWSWSHSYLKFN